MMMESRHIGKYCKVMQLVHGEEQKKSSMMGVALTTDIPLDQLV